MTWISTWMHFDGLSKVTTFFFKITCTDELITIRWGTWIKKVRFDFVLTLKWKTLSESYINVWRLQMLDVVCRREGGRKECEARQEHLSALRLVWWGVVLVCSRPAQKSAGPVNLAQLCCLFGLTQRSPRGYGSRSLKEAFVLKQEICYKYLPWGECKGLALGQPDCGYKIHCTFLN